MMESAPREEFRTSGEGPYDGATRLEMMTLAVDAKNALLEKINDPMVHKAIVMAILFDLKQWHKDCAERHLQEGQLSALSWAADCTNLQNAMDLIAEVDLGKSDFFCHDVEE